MKAVCAIFQRSGMALVGYAAVIAVQDTRSMARTAVPKSENKIIWPTTPAQSERFVNRVIDGGSKAGTRLIIWAPRRQGADKRIEFEDPDMGEVKQKICIEAKIPLASSIKKLRPRSTATVKK